MVWSKTLIYTQHSQIMPCTKAPSTNFRETQGLEVKRSKSPGCSDTCSLHNSGDSLLGLNPTYMSSSNTVLPGRRYRTVVALFSDWQAIWDWQIHFTFRTLRRNYAWRRRAGVVQRKSSTQEIWFWYCGLILFKRMINRTSQTPFRLAGMAHGKKAFLKMEIFFRGLA